MDIKIRGDDIEGIFSSIDYYQSIATSIKSATEIRKGYLESLLDEYDSELPQRLKKVYGSSNSKTSEKKKPIVENTKSVMAVGNSSSVDEVNTKDVTADTYVESGVFLDDTSNIFSEVKNEEVPNGVFLDDYMDSSTCVRSSSSSKSQVDDLEYVDKGVVLEDIDVLTSSTEEEINWGEEEQDFDEENDFKEESDFDEESDWADEDSEESDWANEDDIDWLSSEDSTSNEDSDNMSGQYADSNPSKGIEGIHSVNISIGEIAQEKKSSKFEPVDLSDDFDIDDKISTLLDEGSDKKKDDTSSKVVAKAERVDSRRNRNTTSNAADKKEYYPNVRDFVKKHPGCSSADIKKFFSSRDIQRALMSSKIVEKRGKYYIV